MDIPLTNSSLVAIVDDEDAGRVLSVKWMIQKRDFLYHVRSTTSKIYLHQFVMGRAPDGLEWDHRDRDGLNNRRGNLRLATSIQNQANAKKRKDNTSGFKGVTRRGDRWQARMQINKREKSLGMFRSAEEAGRAYNQAALEHFGEFARGNP